ncbi:MAG: Rnase Y domain-containing protein, partial [Peptoanaerobacter stomatis]|uniref:Rnase Y domain-containing protein n=1 Tax=Peptoanaerobacter stomatis TaxID=796937 RepID=UPI003FA06DD0
MIIGFFIRKYTSEKKIGTAETYVKELIEKSQKDAEAQKKEKIIEAKEEIHKMRNEYDKEYKDRRNELQKFEKRLVQKEETLDKKILQVEEKDKKLADVKTQLIEKEKEVDEIKEQQIRKLEDISNLTLDEAKKYVLEISEKEVRYELSAKIKELEMQAKEEADNKAREIVAYAIQRVAAEQVSETTVSVVNLPNDEMKGRIIGREGRNIRAIENMTGVDLIV